MSDCMGFFSWNCRGCGKSVRSRFANAGRGNWMSRAVALDDNGLVVKGKYDGYGRIERDDGGEDHEMEYGGDFALWHEACWEAAGKPEYDGVKSSDARDQGYFCVEVLTLFPPGHDHEEVRRVHTAEVAGILAEIQPQLEALNLSEHWTFRLVANTAEHMVEMNRKLDAGKVDP